MKVCMRLGVWIALWLSITISLAQPVTAQNVPSEVQALQGQYKGAWTMYGVNDKGDVVKISEWTDTVTAENATVKGDRAFITFTQVMTWADGKIPSRTIKGSEGYFLKSDGSLGDYFYEVYGQITRQVPANKTTWVGVSPAAPQELASLGFSGVSSAEHVLIKKVLQENGRETHRISRITTVSWKDKEGKERTTQFLSLQGYHQRQSQ